MFKIIILMSAFATFAASACVNRFSTASYFHHETMTCSLLEIITIVEPTIEVNGQRYRFGIDQGDSFGGCPKNVSCYPPYNNMMARFQAICKSYGFRKYVDSNSHVFKSGHTKIAFFERTGQGKFRPKVVPNTGNFFTVKSISCLE